MKKTVLAAALAALTLGTAQAQTSVRLYGLADAFAGNVKTSTPGASASATKIDAGGMTTSYWGIGGTEDLGGGLKAVFAFESFMRNDTGELGRFNGDPAFARSSFVGLEGGFGRVSLGRHTTPYFISTIVYNPFGDSFSFSPAVMHSYRGYLLNDSGWSNSVAYGGSFGPVRASLLYSLGLERTSDPNRNAGRSLGGSLNYGQGPLGLNLAYQEVEVASGTPEAITKQKAMLLSGSYDLSVAKLFLQYQELKDDRGAFNKKDKSYQIGASVPVGPGSVLASYGHVKTTDNDSTTADAKRDSWALGYDYFLSKRTDLYAAWFDTKLKTGSTTASKSRAVGVGIRHRF